MKVITIISLTALILGFTREAVSLPTPLLDRLPPSLTNLQRGNVPVELRPDSGDWSTAEHKPTPEKRFWNMRYYCGGFVCGHSKRNEISPKPIVKEQPEAPDIRDFYTVRVARYFANLFKRIWEVAYSCDAWACTQVYGGKPVMDIAASDIRISFLSSSSTKDTGLPGVRSEQLESSAGEDHTEGIFKRFWNMRYYCGGWVCAHTR